MITLYPPTEKIIDKIKSRVESFGSVCEISAPIKWFRQQYNIAGDHDPVENHNKCLDWCCHTVRGNKIGACYYPVMADIANEHWGLAIPGEECSYDYTTDEYSGAELLKLLVSPSKICAFCNSIPSPVMEWCQEKGNSDLSDWFYVT